MFNTAFDINLLNSYTNTTTMKPTFDYFGGDMNIKT